MGKDKKEKRKSEGGDDQAEGGDSKEVWNTKVQHLNAIAQPLAPRKLTKRLYKAIKKGKDCDLFSIVSLTKLECLDYMTYALGNIFKNTDKGAELP